SFLPNLAKHPRPSFLGQVNPALISSLWRGRYDAVWIWGYTTASAWLAVMAAKIMGIKVLFRGEANLAPSRFPFKLAVKNIVVRCFLKMVDSVAYSCTANRHYYEHYGVRADQLLFVPCAVDNTRFRFQALQIDRSKIREQLRLGVNEK